MAQFSIEIADADVNRVLGSVAANYGRPDKVPKGCAADVYGIGQDFSNRLREKAISQPTYFIGRRRRSDTGSKE